jgi:ActR/RegA family two-component response regulator
LTLKPSGFCNIGVYFPVSRQKSKQKIEAIPIEKYSGNEKILVVDDIAEQREIASALLSTIGYSETARAKEAQRLGAGAYIKKPYSLEDIGLAVRTELDR